MRIQKRLVLSNMAMILIPMGLIITTNVVLGFMFNLGHDRITRLWPRASDILLVSRAVSADPLFYEDPSRTRIVESTIGWDGYIELKRGGAVVYSGSRATGAGDGPDAQGSDRWSHGRPSLVASIALSGTETELDLYLDRRAVAASYFLPSVVYLLIVAGILILTNGTLAALVSRSVTRPLAQLEARALRIRDGDLSPAAPLLAERQHGRDEFDPVFDAFDEMRERLRISLERQLEDEANRRELIASISHDLRTPLAVIKGYAEGLRDGVAADPARSAAYIQTILSKAAQLDRLIEDLFLFSRLELDGFAWDLHPVALGGFLSDCMDELAADHPSLNVSTVCGADPLVRLDAQKLRRVFANIVQNAASYAAAAGAAESGQRGRLDVTLRIDYGKAIVVLRDYGPGLLPGTEDRVFERFYRADTSRAGGGAGLGLAIARRIVTGHGGAIRAENAAGGGAAFIIELPLAASANPQAAAS